jgi:methyl-accepting chemotaxis protein
MKMKINTRLVLMVAALITVTLTFICILVFFTYRSSLDNNLKKIATSESLLIREQTEAWFQPYFSEVQGASYVSAQIADSKGDVLPLLKKILKNHPEMSDVYWSGEVPVKDGGFFIDAGGWTPPADYDQTKRAWFSDTKKQSGVLLTDPYLDMITKKLVVTVAANVVSPTSGNQAGVVGIDLFITKVGEMINAQKISANGHSFLINMEGKYITNDRAEAILAEKIQDDPVLGSVAASILQNESIFAYTPGGKYYYSSIKLRSATWYYVTYGPISDIYAALWSFLLLLVIAGVLSLLVAMVFVLVVARSLSRPIVSAIAVAAEISSGDLRSAIDAKLLARSDEIGTLATALQQMREKLSRIIEEVVSASNQVAAGSQQLSSTSQQMSQGATEQASSVEEISSSMEEMTSNIKQNADNALQTEKIAQKSATSVEEGGKAVQATVTAMKEIASKIGIIEEIARSTNMLALNASIEAARAGEYGKGFAVVASEVGKLAERSQKEAGEISKLSIDSVTIAEQAGTTISAMIPDIKRTAELVQEISAASNEQNAGAEQINSAILQLDKVVQQNASASEESASMSEELASQSEQMQSMMSYFKTKSTATEGGLINAGH